MKTKSKNKIKANNTKGILIYYLGQEGFILDFSNLVFCIDPYLSDYVDKNCSTSTIKWKRLYSPTIKGSDLNFVDYFLFTHTHFDHCDPWTIKDILKTNKKAKFIIGVNNVKTLLSYGVKKSNVIPISVKKPLMINDIKITAIPAKHDIFHKCNNEFDELCYLFQKEKIRIFHGGDTLYYPKLENYIRNSNVCLLPINGRDEFRTKNDIIGNLNPMEAFSLMKKSKSSLLIPIHNDLYKINRSNANEIKVAIKKYKDVKYLMLKHDEFYEVKYEKSSGSKTK